MSTLPQPRCSESPGCGLIRSITPEGTTRAVGLDDHECSGHLLPIAYELVTPERDRRPPVRRLVRHADHMRRAVSLLIHRQLWEDRH